MALKVWYNGSMKSITNPYKLVTFVNGQKKYLTKGVTFINGQKKVLWDIGQVKIDSWTLDQLGFSGAQYVPIGMQADYGKVVYNVGNYINRNNISNISSPTLENSVQNGFVNSWDSARSTGTNLIFGGNLDTLSSRAVQTYSGGAGGPSTIRPTTVFYYTFHLDSNTFDINTSTDVVNISTNRVSNPEQDMTAWIGTGRPNSRYTSLSRTQIGGRVYAGTTYNWITVICVGGKYVIYKNSNVKICEIASNGFGGYDVPEVPKMLVYNDQYLFISYEYQATSGGAYTYGIKRITLSNGSVTDINSLPNPITAMMVDGSYLIISYGKTLQKINTSGSEQGIYEADKIITFLGRIGDYYYVATNRQSGSAYLLDIQAIRKSNMQFYARTQTNYKMMFVNAIPYISNNQYLCFGMWHGVSGSVAYTNVPRTTAGTTKAPTLNNTTASATTWTDLETRLTRIEGY